jgi:transposase
MATATPCLDQQTACPPPLFRAFELGENQWKLGFTTGAAQRPRERQVAAGEGPTVLAELRRAKPRLGWPEHPRGISGYEAGRDGVWLQRFLVRHGRENAGVDSARLAVKRRDRRAKTDRRDGPKRLPLRLRDAVGERQVWRVVRGPRVAAEDRRHLQRARLTAKRARPRVSKRLQGWRAGSGGRLALHGDVEAQLEQGHPADGALGPPAWLARLQGAGQPGCFLTAQSTGLEGERRAARRPRQEPVMEQVRPLSPVRGLGGKRAWVCGRDCLAWRDVPTPKPGGA